MILRAVDFTLGRGVAKLPVNENTTLRELKYMVGGCGVKCGRPFPAEEQFSK